MFLEQLLDAQLDHLLWTWVKTILLLCFNSHWLSFMGTCCLVYEVCVVVGNCRTEAWMNEQMKDGRKEGFFFLNRVWRLLEIPFHFYLSYFMCVNALLAHMYVHRTWCPHRQEDCVESFGMGVKLWTTIWVLQTKPRFSARVACALKFWAIAPDESSSKVARTSHIREHSIVMDLLRRGYGDSAKHIWCFCCLPLPSTPLLPSVITNPNLCGLWQSHHRTWTSSLFLHLFLSACLSWV